jgi:anthranilate/para-aminobenzoate synthase component I
VPFVGGWVGYLGYEARSGVERTPAPRAGPLGFPCLWLGWADAALLEERATGRRYLAGLGPSRAQARAAARRLARRLARRSPSAPVGRARATGGVTTRPALEPAAYRAQVAAVRRHVRAGDIFQANLSQRFDARGVGEPVALFRRLVAEQPAPYMTYLGLGKGRAILSASPERFLEVRARRVATDPMKGTRPRGATRAEDQRLARDLARSEKDRAELAMILDLSRNDLARVCRPGSVRVRLPRRLLPFARVHQAIGVVEGVLAPSRTRVHLLEAAFPPGSVTGAPKVRAMELLDGLEPVRRGPYAGAVGYLSWGAQALDTAIAIRTCVVLEDRVLVQAGAGIVADSDPERELAETEAKARAALRAVALAQREHRTGSGPVSL